MVVVIQMAEESSQKREGLILELNKTGLAYLVSNQFGQALDYFKKAERAVTEELRLAPSQQKLNQIAGITFNNLACYYKKNNKPKVALGYLKRALELEVYRVEDWVSTASTHINICAIYSHLQKHAQAAEHAQLALTMLSKVEPGSLKQEEQAEQSYSNTLMLSHYNLAIEFQHLRQYPQAREHLLLAQEVAKKNKKQAMQGTLQEALQRVEEAAATHTRKVVEILAKRRQQEEKGNHQFMRRNKKNYGDPSEWRSVVNSKKYEIYKSESDAKRQHQSTEKVKRLAPLGEGALSRRAFEQP